VITRTSRRPPLIWSVARTARIVSFISTGNFRVAESDLSWLTGLVVVTNDLNLVDLLVAPDEINVEGRPDPVPAVHVVEIPRTGGESRRAPPLLRDVR